MNGEVVDPTGVSDPAPYPGLIIEEMMESASEAGEARDSKSERVSYLPLLDCGVLPVARNLLPRSCPLICCLLMGQFLKGSAEIEWMQSSF